MNNKYGLQLIKLLVSNAIETREISLFDGLNVISGPTDTGKSYIYQVIKYILGSNTKPKDIPENKDFNDIYLELYSYTLDSVFTLKRTLSTNKIHIYNSCYYDIGNDSKYITVNTKGPKNNISTKILEYSGINSNVKIKTHIRKNSNRKIALRDLLLLTSVSEQEVISEKSVLRTGQHTSMTVELNLFYYFISGKHTSFLTYLSDKKAREKGTKVKKSNKSENIISRLYEETKNEIQNLEQVEVTDGVSYTDDLLFVTSQIDIQSKQLKEIYENIQKLKSKTLFNNELLKRFNLLKDQFNSDLQRLEFILEGGEILSKLSPENCPTCGKKLEECSLEHMEPTQEKVNPLNGEALFKSYNSERKKILLNLNDLTKTIQNLELDNNNLDNTLISKEEEFLKIKEQIDKELKPTQESLKEKITQEVDSKLVRAKIEYLKNKLIKLQEQGTQSGNETEDKLNHEEIEKIINENIEKLCSIMNDYLIQMKFPDVQCNDDNVKFDSERNDFVISNKHRAVYGKGYRAILYSVFLISFMKFCKENSLPHLGIVIIDSPLTTYQEADENNNREERISDELKSRFINTFGNEKKLQIIILENKFPMEIRGFNFIEFTGDEQNGRYGFM